MQTNSQQSNGLGFVIGLMAGTVVGAGLMLWLAPESASELRDRMNESARALANRASAGYDDASSRVGDAVDEIARKGNRMRNGVADSVVRGAHEVERFAVAVKSDGAARG